MDINETCWADSLDCVKKKLVESIESHEREVERAEQTLQHHEESLRRAQRELDEIEKLASAASDHGSEHFHVMRKVFEELNRYGELRRGEEMKRKNRESLRKTAGPWEYGQEENWRPKP